VKESNTRFYFHVLSDYEVIVSAVSNRSGHATQHNTTFCFILHAACASLPCSMFRWLHYILISLHTEHASALRPLTNKTIWRGKKYFIS